MKLLLPFGLLVCAATSASARATRPQSPSIAEKADRIVAGQYVWQGTSAPGGSVLLVIDLSAQRARVYRNERPRFASSVLANIVNWDFVAQNLDGQGFERANQGEGARSPELTS